MINPENNYVPNPMIIPNPTPYNDDNYMMETEAVTNMNADNDWDMDIERLPVPPGTGQQQIIPGHGQQGQYPGYGQQGQHPGYGQQGQHPGFGQQGIYPNPPPYIPRRPYGHNDLGSISHCLNRLGYMCLNNGNNFWVRLSGIDRRMVRGHMWNGRMWIYFDLSQREIATFICI